jgi:hypothetical protein
VNGGVSMRRRGGGGRRSSDGARKGKGREDMARAALRPSCSELAFTDFRPGAYGPW